MQKRVLIGFLVCGGFSTLLQIALVLALLFAFDAVVQKIESREHNPAKYNESTCNGDVLKGHMQSIRRFTPWAPQ